jgi:hypothetical protein
VIWGWISREHHSEVIAAKDALILALQEQLARTVEVTVTLPKDFAVIQPAVIQKPVARRKKDRQDTPFNYADVDETNANELKALVDFNLGQRAKMANSFERRQALSSVLVQIRAAKEARLRERLRSTELTTPVIQAEAPQDEDVDESNVPAHVRALIADAESGV